MKAALSCKNCGQLIGQATAEHTNGLCVRCYKAASVGRVTMKLLCTGCGRKYMLGMDAIVTTPEDVIYRVGSWIGGNPTTALYADIVGPLEWSLLLDDEQTAKEKEDIRALQQVISDGRSRKWKCLKCGRVQKYSPVPSWR